MYQSRSFLALVFASLTLPALARAGEPFRFPEGRCGTNAELKYVNQVPVLVVSGSPEQRPPTAPRRHACAIVRAGTPLPALPA